jgi:tRNA nucleotidyltransferase/poly(A) polymerase
VLVLFVTNGLTTENLTTLFEKSSHTGKHFCSAIAYKNTQYSNIFKTRKEKKDNSDRIKKNTPMNQRIMKYVAVARPTLG